MKSPTARTATPEQIDECRAVRNFVRLLDEAGWERKVQHAVVDRGESEKIESLGIVAAQDRRRVLGVWERVVIAGEPGKWKRTPGYLWGPITGGSGLMLWMYMARVGQAEMNAWVSDPDKWWSEHLPHRPEGSWGFFR